jgi:hypothetical protein
LEEEIRKKVEAVGGRMEQIEGWEPLTEERLKQQHLVGIQRQVGDFAQIIALKDFLLAGSAPDRSFYLGDNPVCLNNKKDFGPYGNLGLAVPGIEIYLPLSSDLMLCAWCPSILIEAKVLVKTSKAECEGFALGELMAGRISAPEMKKILDDIRPDYVNAESMFRAFEEGVPMSSSNENMDYYNSLQMTYANRYVTSKHGDFDLAKRHNHEFPNLRRGKRPKFG